MPVLKTFLETADTFVKYADNTVQILAASRDWFLEEWGRDTFISLPGILLVTKRFEEARAVIENFSSYEQKGLIPNRIQGGLIEYNTVDAPMWFIQAVKSYLKYTNDLDFVHEILPVLRKIIEAYKHGTSYPRFGPRRLPDQAGRRLGQPDARILVPSYVL